MIKRKVGMERNLQSGSSSTVVRHHGCSMASTFLPQARRSQAPQARQSPCQVINNHQLQNAAKQAAPWECSLHQTRNIKNPKLDTSQEFKCFLLLTWLRGKKVKNRHKKPRLSAFRAFL